MKDSDKLISIDKEVKVLKEQLEDVAVQLAGVFLDEEQTLEDCTLIDEIEELEKRIPEIKGDMIRIKGYTQSITESEEQIKSCNEKIKSYEASQNSLYEKIGIELYGTLTDDDLVYSAISTICSSLKEKEKKSETLESTLYKQENSVAKRKFVDNIMLPFKLGSIKKDIKKNNKEILSMFRELGKAYTGTPELIQNDGRNSLKDLLNEYQSLFKLLNNQIEKRALLNSGIEEKNKMIKEGSKGLKLKTLYSNLEDDIVQCQEMITKKLGELGHFIPTRISSDYDSEAVIVKLQLYLSTQSKIAEKEKVSLYYSNKVRLNQLKKEIKGREQNIILAENHIKECKKNLTKHKKELTEVSSQAEELKAWLESNSKISEE